MPAGRPAELDSNGRPITKCLVNCTIPVKLRDFLAEHNINRSELFRTAALKMMELKICPYCYSHNIRETAKGHQCEECNKWLKFKRCDLCEAIHTRESYLASVNDAVGCDQCPEHIKEKEENKLISLEVVSLKEI